MNSSSWRSEPGRKARLALTITLAALGAGCATGGVQSIRTDLDSIQQQLFKVQKDSAALADAVKDLRAPAPQPAGAATAPGPEDLVLMIQAIERDLAAFKTRQDEAEARTSALAQEIRSAREVLRGLMNATPVAPAGGPAATPSQPGIPAGAPPVEAPAAGATRGGEAAPPVPSGTALLPGDLYRRAYADYSRGNYDLALQELSEFLQRNPEGDLADDAQYLIGEVHFSRQAYPEAVAAFDRVVQNYPASDKAGAAYLKKGLALLEMNRTADAVIQLQHVITAFPRSDEARIARDRLKGLGLSER